MTYPWVITANTQQRSVQVGESLHRIRHKVYINGVLSNGIIWYITRDYIILRVLPVRWTPRKLLLVDDDSDCNTEGSGDTSDDTITSKEASVAMITRVTITEKINVVIEYESDEDSE